MRAFRTSCSKRSRAETPVVTPAHHGLGEVLTDGTDALLVDDEPGALATAFDRLAADEPLRRRLRNGRRASHW